MYYFINLFILLWLAVLFSACAGIKDNDSSISVNEGFAEEGDAIEQPELVSNKILGVVDDTVVIFDSELGKARLFSGDDEVFLSYLEDGDPVRVYTENILADLKRSAGSITPPARSSFRRISNTKGELRVNGLVLKTQSVSGGHLADAWVMAENDSGFWVQQEELLETKVQYKSQQVHRLNPIGALRHYDVNGTLLGQVSVALVKPRKHLNYFHIDNENRPFYIEYQSATKSTVPRRLNLDSPGALSLPTHNVQDDKVLSDIIPMVDDATVKSFESLIRANDVSPAALRPPSTSREQIMARAQEILNTRWLLNSENFASNKTNRCRQPESIWLRPKKLKPSVLDSEVIGPPYKWGGNQSLAAFNQKIAEGYTAGDVCTCRCRKGSACTARDWCIDASTVGFDCSGFVSNAWAIPYHSTSTLHKVGIPIRWQELEPGDILNSPGRHVRLFVSFVDGDVTKIQTIESAVSCSGLCKKNYRVSELAGYIPYRYMHLE